MPEWKPDTEFLDYLLKYFEEGCNTGLDEPFFCTPDGTKKGGEGYSIREMIENMREGKSPAWQQMYQTYYKEREGNIPTRFRNLQSKQTIG